MTRKDFCLIAAALKVAPGMNIDPFTHRMIVNGVERAALRLADALQTTNPRFDRARFLAACAALFRKRHFIYNR